jgi:hypothetical protein
VRAALAALVLVLLGTTAPASALEPLGDRGVAVVNGGGGEFFMTPVPIDWAVAHASRTDRIVHMAWVPEGQSAEGWADKVSVQLYPGAAGMTGPELLDRLAEQYDADCRDLLATEVQTRQKHGHRVSFRFLGCTRHADTGRGQLALFRTIEGAQSFYLVQRAWRTPAFARDTLPFDRELLGKTRLWLQGGRVCDATSTDPERACPPRLADAIQRTSLERPIAVLDLGEGGGQKGAAGAGDPAAR